MIQVVPKTSGFPEKTATQVAINVLTFNTQAVVINTNYVVCDENGRQIQTGNYPMPTSQALPTSFSPMLVAIEDEVLSYLELERLV